MQRRRPQQHQQPTQHPPGAPATSLTATTSNVKGGGLPAQGLIHVAQFAAQSSGNHLPGFSYVHTVVLVDSVSENGVFAFGFWEKDGDDVDEFVVGIRYNLGDKATNFPVWTIGEGLRVAKNSTFRIAMDGKLVLINNPNGIIVWSSNTSSLGVQKASLLDNGNLVLLGNKDEVIWRALVVQQTLYFLVSHSITLLALKVLR
ncbi:Receptor-like serine/threonine-protein kinase [Forsythia ovata]|uniref:Receptor-like serine/threonine-protein kinase n=1 Tax=Forsythia ovata TaxID=205694 RepID=A0ABD1UVQ3_9LAMI